MAVLCDFDGTISTTDVADYILREFTDGSMEEYDKMYNEGKIGYEEYVKIMDAQFSRHFSLNGTLEQVKKAALSEARIRKNFGKLVDYCYNRYPLVIVSLGMDFVVKQVLEHYGWLDRVQISMPVARFRENGFAFEHPVLRYEYSQSIKDDAVTYFQKIGKTVVYIGDGTPDYAAAEKSDIRFSVKDSTLSDLFKKNGIPFHEFSDFGEVIEVIQHLW